MKAWRIAHFIVAIVSTTLGGVEKSLTIITASYNNSSFARKYFDSIAQQQYSHWSLIYIDDASTDDMQDIIMQCIHEYQLEHKITYIRNTERKGHLYNQYHAIHTCPPDTIILIVDGDDWLAHDQVFSVINNTYHDENVWLTYGQFWYLKKNKKGFCRSIPPEVIANNGIREISWRTTHLRTFYAGLFQQIKKEDLLYNDNFFPFCTDVVTMFAMIEMAGDHIKFIPEILYIYNDDNPLSYHHDPTPQRKMEEYIRTLPRYQPLKGKAW